MRVAGKGGAEGAHVTYHRCLHGNVGPGFLFVVHSNTRGNAQQHGEHLQRDHPYTCVSRQAAREAWRATVRLQTQAELCGGDVLQQ